MQTPYIIIIKRKEILTFYIIPPLPVIHATDKLISHVIIDIRVVCDLSARCQHRLVSYFLITWLQVSNMGK